jgi:14-3-3 protein epsilon
MSSDRLDNIFLAKVSEQAERYSEMVDFMSKLVQQGGEFSVEERNLLSVAYKNVIGSRRESLRTLTYLKGREENERQAQLLASYRQKIEEELTKICNEVISLLDNSLIPSSSASDAKVFYYTLKGDYYRYLAEFLDGERRDGVAKNALAAYQTAQELAEKDLASTHPIRLSLSLNFSVCYYEILDQPDKARELAKRAFDNAIAQLDDLTDEAYKDSTLIMQLLRDNLTLWTAGMDGNGGDDSDDSDDN